MLRSVVSPFRRVSRDDPPSGQPWNGGGRRVGPGVRAALPHRAAGVDLPASDRAGVGGELLVRAALHGWRLERSAVAEDVRLLTAAALELAWDRADHDVDLRLDLEYRGGRLRCTVANALPASAPMPSAGLRRRRAAGRALLTDLADRWGREPIPGGERLWFELAVPDGRAPLPGAH
ncbi:MAG TPA: hypothetical protein VGH99_00540 [Pseudonocardia sp.]